MTWDTTPSGHMLGFKANQNKCQETEIVSTVLFDGYEIKVAVVNNEVVISANKEGMLSLAKQLAALAEGAPGDHIHYDEHNSLEDGSAELIIERI